MTLFADIESLGLLISEFGDEKGFEYLGVRVRRLVSTVIQR
ncbi:MAG: hypothetical protein ACI90U_001216 [Pseudomonadales bacterium]|jgi:hypothetical protein